VLLKLFDIPYMGKAALATHWDRTTPEQRERFLQAVISSEARRYTSGSASMAARRSRSPA